MIREVFQPPNSAAISEALYYNTIFEAVKEFFEEFLILRPGPSSPLLPLRSQLSAPAKLASIARFFDRSRPLALRTAPGSIKKALPERERFLRLVSSLTMTYFHTGIRTIIGAESFHCPVRDGKEWFQLAMVIRL